MIKNINEIKKEIVRIFENKEKLFDSIPESVALAIKLLDHGECRICKNINGEWKIEEWLKQAILLYFKYSNCVKDGFSYDKIPLKFTNWSEQDFAQAEIRAVPGAIVRYGTFLAPKVVLMNCFINIGAYIGEKTMVDSFATIGSCAQIGANCHIASGCVIGGVLEPTNAAPVIIEDDCLIGANAAVTEGIIIRKGATIAMGVRIGASVKIIERTTNKIFFGEVPQNAVVVPGTYQSANGLHIGCAVIVGYKDRGTKINEELR
ncbi:MAG: 2,3,4,5-tetrahydropyridine-2,6-dicarboxylate N-succinyltransferase [Holosporales bacterium]|jgi:2,3,4,5-tetrahydropyridine-2-carboxylate N-succinyltransferase|nr:2,3,4,5-tetrahydropyridine-2,6-dicarboxylate N-succinyltransferase [Holosporales bacterium]